MFHQVKVMSLNVHRDEIQYFFANLLRALRVFFKRIFEIVGKFVFVSKKLMVDE